MRSINAWMLAGFLGALGLTSFACQKNTNDSADTPKSSDEDKGDKGDKVPISESDKKGQCGGFAGLQCADGEVCVDDPSDTCDPMKGGADCMGVCVKDDKDKKCDYEADATKTYVGMSPEACATMKFVCEEGKTYFADECGCGCVGS